MKFLHLICIFAAVKFFYFQIMTWIVLLLLVGILLFFVELFFIPGTTVIGFIGVFFVAAGIFYAYSQYGRSAGHISLLISLTLVISLIIYGAKSNAWGKLSHKHSLEGKANVIDENAVNVGDTGKAVSDIKPIGKAMFNNQYFEVKSHGEYIDHGKSVEVINVSGNKIIVKEVKA